MSDRPRLGVRLLDDELGLRFALLLQLLGCTLGRDERRAQQRLELTEAHELVLELLDLVRQVGAVAPDVLEARGDVLEHLVDERALVAEERSLEPDVPDLHRGECHGAPSLQSVEQRVQRAAGRRAAR